LTCFIETKSPTCYKLHKSRKGRDYIIRPDAQRVLKHAKDNGFRVIIITCNLKKYADDILESSGLIKYIDGIKSNEDLRKAYNKDFDTYPRHRNKLIKQKRFLNRWTKGFYNASVKRSFLRMLGNKNIKPYLPKKYIEKYPPLYGSRFHVDNLYKHVKAPLDYVGLNVSPFYGTDLELSDESGEYLWSETVIQELDSLKQYGWERLYFEKYLKQPVIDYVPVVSSYFQRYPRSLCPNQLLPRRLVLLENAQLDFPNHLFS